MRSVLVIAITAAALTAAPIDKKDVEYGRPGGHALLLDLHIPDGPGPFPAAILVHGGGFDGGSKSTNCRPLFEPLANARLRLVQHRLPHGARVPFPARPRTTSRAPSAGSKPTPGSIASMSRRSRSLAKAPAAFWSTTQGRTKRRKRKWPPWSISTARWITPSSRSSGATIRSASI